MLAEPISFVKGQDLRRLMATARSQQIDFELR
jgi:hypothetical protein